MRTAHSPAAALAALLACLVVCACSGAAADPVTPQDALAAAQTWLSLDDTPLGCHLGGMIGGVRPWIDGTGRTLFYIASLQPEGYIILSPDNLVEPIVAFSHTGDYDSSPANPMSSLASRDLASRLDLVRNRQPLQGADPAASSAAAKWNMLLGLTPAPLAGLSGISDPRVSPMVQSRWSQSNEGAACYNYYVPPNSDGSTSNHPCGCVATAMAQTMRFFQYPASGIGVHSFSISVCGAIAARSTRGGDGSGGAYNWALMTLDPDSSTSTESRQQIGALCADAGFAVNMDYCSDGSGIYDLQKVVDRLKGTFLSRMPNAPTTGPRTSAALLSRRLSRRTCTQDIP